MTYGDTSVPDTCVRHLGSLPAALQVVMMGSGEERYANFLRRAEAENPGKVCGYVGFTAEMEHKIIAGADILLMPSRSPPCPLHVYR